jgi:hypothetical protein
MLIALALVVSVNLLGTQTVLTSRASGLALGTLPVARQAHPGVPGAPVVSGLGAQSSPVRRVNAPFFAAQVLYSQTAIFWFGRVTPTENYADVRVGYSSTELYVNVAIFDRRLWYDLNPSPDRLTAADAVSLYLRPAGNTGNAPDAGTYHFLGQLNWYEPRDRWQAAYRGAGGSWSLLSLPFSTESGWRGDEPNDDVDDRGWWVTFHIPFASLRLASAPDRSTIWGMAVAVHDRDDAGGTPIPDKVWPEVMDPLRPGTWGQLAFGLPGYAPSLAALRQTVAIRQGLNGAAVNDAEVGGGTNCGDGLDMWTQWGNKNYLGQSSVNVQNQSDVSDWPCFSKYYLTFPTQGLPRDRVVISATLTLFQFGNAGQGWQPPPEPSYIQVLSTSPDWQPGALTWNNAPLAIENLSATWVHPLDQLPPSPGIARQWDVALALSQAYMSGQPLGLVVYSADWPYHSGRYFRSSNMDVYEAAARPLLTVVLGEPGAHGTWVPLLRR